MLGLVLLRSLRRRILVGELDLLTALVCFRSQGSIAVVGDSYLYSVSCLVIGNVALAVVDLCHAVAEYFLRLSVKVSKFILDCIKFEVSVRVVGRFKDFIAALV